MKPILPTISNYPPLNPYPLQITHCFTHDIGLPTIEPLPITNYPFSHDPKFTHDRILTYYQLPRILNYPPSNRYPLPVIHWFANDIGLPTIGLKINRLLLPTILNYPPSNRYPLPNGIRLDQRLI